MISVTKISEVLSVHDELDLDDELCLELETNNGVQYFYLTEEEILKLQIHLQKLTRKVEF